MKILRTGKDEMVKVRNWDGWRLVKDETRQHETLIKELRMEEKKIKKKRISFVTYSGDDAAEIAGHHQRLNKG